MVYSFLDQPDFGHLAAAAVAAEAGFAIPREIQFAAGRGGAGDVEFDGADRLGLEHEGVDLDFERRRVLENPRRPGGPPHKPDFAAWTIACVHDANAILRRSIETCVAHLQRLIVRGDEPPYAVSLPSGGGHDLGQGGTFRPSD